MPDERMQRWLVEFGVPPAILALVKNVVSAATAPAGPAAPPQPGPLEQAAAHLELPRPMEPDCKPVRGKAPGPDNIRFCAKHGHIVDVNTGMIVAKNGADYLARAKTAAVDTAKTVGKTAIAGVEALPGGKTAVAAVEDAVADAAKLPRPIQPDCKLVHLKGGAPDNIYLCLAHGHIIDVKLTMIIANDRKSYEADVAGGKAVEKLVKKVVGVVKDGMAAAKEHAAGEAEAKKRAELDKAIGVVPVAISLLIGGPDGPVSDLSLQANAMADGGVGEGTWYSVPLRMSNAGIYVGDAAPLPPTGVLEIAQGIGGLLGGLEARPATFDPVRYTARANGVLRIKATEKKGEANAKLRHFDVKIGE